MPWKCVLPLKWVPQVPRIWEHGPKTDRSRPRSVPVNASVDGSGLLPAGRQTESYSAKSGYNKGTIRSNIRHLVVSKDVRRHRLISTDYITTLRCHCSGLDSQLPRGRLFWPTWQEHAQVSYLSYEDRLVTSEWPFEHRSTMLI